VRPPTFSST